jgi:hypothetical protein
MEYLAGAGIVVGIVVFVIGALINAAFLLLGTKILNIPDRTFGKAFLSSILGYAAWLIVSLILAFIPIIGWILAFIGGFLITAILVQHFFKTEFGKALGATVIAWILTWIVLVIIGVIITVIFGVGVAMMHGAGA